MCNYNDKFIYISGGHISLIVVDKVTRYNIDTEMWEDVVNLNVKRTNHSSCAFKESIYVVGGFDRAIYM